jgi:hypothetical protein
MTSVQFVDRQATMHVVLGQRIHTLIALGVTDADGIVPVDNG